MRAAFAAFLLALAQACHPTAKPAVPPTSTLEVCLSPELMSPWLFGKRTLVDGYECGICSSNTKCVTTSFIYCATGYDDPACGPSYSRGR